MASSNGVLDEMPLVGIAGVTQKQSSDTENKLHI